MARLILICVIVSANAGAIFSEDSTKVASTTEDPSLLNSIHKGSSKSRTLFDYQTRIAAYKDLIESRCLLEFLKGGGSFIGQLSEKSRSQNLSKNFFMAENQLSKAQIYTIGGQRVVEFCRGFPTYLIYELKTNDQENAILNDIETGDAAERTKRSTRHFFVGRVRGQTQSQYLNFGNGQDPGKAEAESTYGSSKAVVSGSSGMGQAQSQSIPVGCDGCNGEGYDQGQKLQFGRPGIPEEFPGAQYQQPGGPGYPDEGLPGERPIEPQRPERPGYPSYPEGGIPRERPAGPGYPGLPRPDAPRYPGERLPPQRPSGPGFPGQPRPDVFGYPGAPLPPTGPSVPEQPDYPGQPRPSIPGITDEGFPGQPPTGPPGSEQPGYPGQPRPSVPGITDEGVPEQPLTGPPGSEQPGYPGQPRPGVPGYPGVPLPGQRPIGPSEYPGQRPRYPGERLPGPSEPVQPGYPRPGEIPGYPEEIQYPPRIPIGKLPTAPETPSYPGLPKVERPGAPRIPGFPGKPTKPQGPKVPGYPDVIPPKPSGPEYPGYPSKPTYPIPPDYPTEPGPSYPIEPDYPAPPGYPTLPSYPTYPGKPSPPTISGWPEGYLPGQRRTDGKFGGQFMGDYEAQAGQRGKFSGTFSGQYDAHQNGKVNGQYPGAAQPTYPRPAQPGVPNGIPPQPGYPGYPGGVLPGYPTGPSSVVQPDYPGGVAPGYPGGPPSVAQPGYPGGRKPAYPGGPPSYPGGIQPSYPDGAQPGYPGGVAPPSVPESSYPGARRPGSPGGPSVAIPGLPGGTQARYPVGPPSVEQPGYPGGVQPSYPGGISPITQPGYPGGIQPGYPGGIPPTTQPGYPGGVQPSYPNGVQPGYPGGIPPTTQPGYPGGIQPGYPGGVQPGYPGGIPPTTQPGYPGGVQPGYPGGVQPGYPGGVRPGYPGGVQPGYPGVPVPAEQVRYPGYPGRPTEGKVPGVPGVPSRSGYPGGDRYTAGEEVDDSDSQVQTSVQQTTNETQASASAQGIFAGGTAQSQVSGTYSGSGTFSASAGSDDGKRGAMTQVSGGKEGALSSAQGRGGLGQSQAQVQLASETGDTVSSAQTGGWNHGSQTQVQASGKGGMADAQANGPGSTSSQAQIGFTPYDEGEKDDQATPFKGGGMASAQSGSYSGQAQSQIQGKFQYGIRYTGGAQAGSGSKDTIALARNQSRPVGLSGTFPKFKPLTFTPGKSPATDTQSQVLQNGDRRNIQKTMLTNHGTQEVQQTTPSSSEIEETATEEYHDDDYEDYESEVTTKKPNTKSIISQASKYQRQHIVLDPLEDLDATVQQSYGSYPADGTILQPGQLVPGSPGYQIPPGFRGRVKSIANGKNTYATGRHSQAQSVTLTPGSGRIIYKKPVYAVSSKTHFQNGHIGFGSGYTYQPATYQLKSGKSVPNFVALTKSESGSKNPYTGQKTPSVYYTQSSTCGVFTNTCVFNGSGKLCFPKPKTNPDGSFMSC